MINLAKMLPKNHFSKQVSRMKNQPQMLINNYPSNFNNNRNDKDTLFSNINKSSSQILSKNKHTTSLLEKKMSNSNSTQLGHSSFERTSLKQKYNSNSHSRLGHPNTLIKKQQMLSKNPNLADMVNSMSNDSLNKFYNTSN